MNILTELQKVLKPLKIPLETGIFGDKAPNEYLVLVPMEDTFMLHADNTPGIDVQEVRISVYSKGNYISLVKALIKALIKHEFTITSRQYIGYETETGYHHYNVDISKYYEMEEL